MKMCCIWAVFVLGITFNVPSGLFPSGLILEAAKAQTWTEERDWYIPPASIDPFPGGEDEFSIVNGDYFTSREEFVIRGQLGGLVEISVRGLMNDEVIVRLTSGQELRVTLEMLMALADNPPPDFPLHVSYDILPDGTVVVYIVIMNAQADFNGAVVSLVRNGIVIDSDPVRLSDEPPPRRRSRSGLPYPV